MKAAKGQNLIKKHILPSLPGYAVKGRLLYATPVRYILRGYWFEGSGFDANRFNVEAFAQPLYPPRSHLVLSFGKRLGNLSCGPEIWWDLSDRSEQEIMAEVLERIQQEAEPLLRGIVDPRSFLYWLAFLSNGFEDSEKLDGVLEAGTTCNAAALLSWLKANFDDVPFPHHLEAAAYSYALTGDAKSAKDFLIELKKQCEAEVGSVPWMAEILDRADLVLTAFEQGRDQAQRILERWADETAHALRVPRQRLSVA